MKKAFAVMSAFLIALTCFGFLSKTTVAAADNGLITEDPTLAEDEDPMYIMGSIYTTFPHHYDNAAKPDSAWVGSARMYPWNETRLRVKQYDLATGQPTGRYDAIYFIGNGKHMNGNDKVYGAGKEIYTYEYEGEGAERRVALIQYDQGKRYVRKLGAGYSDPSASHMITNNAGETIVFDAVTDKITSIYNQSMVFDAQGRVVRASAGNAIYLEAGTDGAANHLMPAVFCYVDGKVVKYVEGVTVPDKKMEAVLNEDGTPVLDENGNPKMEQTDEDHFLYKRFLWAWFEEKPEAVNEVGYLEAGWDPQKWDYCYEQDGGYMCYAFMGTDGSELKLSDEDLAKWDANEKAAYVAEKGSDEGYVAKANVQREPIYKIVVPAGGWVYECGYLDRAMAQDGGYVLNQFYKMVIASHKYGREAGYGEQRTYNFSSSGLKTQDVVADGAGYRVIENNVVEIQPGATVKPGQNVIYTGLTQYFYKGEDGNLNDVTQFKASTDSCEFTIVLDGEAVVQPMFSKLKTMDEVAAEFLKDLNAYQGTDVSVDQFKEPFSTGGVFYKTFNGKLEAFEAAHIAKWGWLFNYIRANIADGNSGGNWTTRVWHCLASAAPKSGWPTSPADFKTLNPTMLEEKFLKAKTWDTFSFTASDELDAAYEVEYTVLNRDTGNQDTMVITYIVTDVYTPFIEVNKNALDIKSEVVDGSVVINGGQPITAAQLLKAYSGKYSNITGSHAADMKGREITYKVVLDSETLDFDKPTEGTHSVVARVVAQSSTTYKEALERFTVTIKDRTAPVVSVTGRLNVAYGSTFDPQIGVLAASDNVDGNLKLAAHTWCADISSTPVNTTKPGDYTVTLAIYDSAGNSKEVSYKVTVVGAYSDADQADEIADMVEENGLLISELQEALDGLLAKVNELGAKKGCGKSSAALAIQIFSASSLLVLVLRKKH